MGGLGLDQEGLGRVGGGMRVGRLQAEVDPAAMLCRSSYSLWQQPPHPLSLLGLTNVKVLAQA